MSPGKNCFLRLFIIVLCFLQTSVYASKQLLIYPQPNNQQDKRDLYTVALVKLLFSDSEKYQLKALNLGQEYDRLLALLNRQKIDIAWAGASKSNMKKHRAIHYPIMKGLIGYRLFLVKQGNQDILRNVSTLEDLKRFSIGQGRSWVENDMFQAAGLNVVPAESYAALFSMLNSNRFELFPRSILEITKEIETFAKYDLVVADHVALKYDFALLFYVHNSNEALQNYVMTKLQNENTKQQITRLFADYYQEPLQRYNYNERHIIKIDNPSMPEQLLFSMPPD